MLLSPPVLAGKKALVLGNSAYLHTQPLRNAVNDANDMAARLQGIGFEVHLGLDLNRIETLQVVQQFAQTLERQDTALFFFAGHGVQLGGRNFILPVDAADGNETEMTASAIALPAILTTLERQADTRIIILDACRDNPFQSGALARSANIPRGLGRMEAGVGSFIAFATEPGNVALDGAGRNSPFTDALLRHIGTPGADIHAIMRAVRADVMAASNFSQVPWENSSLISEVFLSNTRAPLSTVPTAPRPQVVAPVPQVRVLPAQPQGQGFSHRVQGLDPNGDGFLALREGITSNARRLAKMSEGTRLNVLQQSGAWYFVQTETGLQGWAHSNWIAANAAPARVSVSLNALSCDQLWHRRNNYFAQGGYCFQSPRGRAAFGHLPCTPGLASSQVLLSPSQKADIAAIQNREAALQCN